MQQLFIDPRGNLGSTNLNVMAKGVHPWWQLAAVLAHPSGDFLEERFGFDEVIRVAYDMSQEPDWWRWDTDYNAMSVERRQGLERLGFSQVLIAKKLTDSAYREICRRLESRP